jgi:beta-lactamase superfamily II metal-dependent hydrolase
MAGRAKKAAAGEVTIRMYNVGFGDAFLLCFPDHERPRWVLVDCGVHPSGPGPRAMKDVVGDIIADVTDDAGDARIDVVVATHRHADHVSGFKDERWADVEVGEVWMPWTEHPTDAKARRIRETQSGLALALTRKPGLDARASDLALNALTNEEAMETLHRGFSGKPKRRYLPPKSRDEATFTSDVLPGITVHALAPSRDEDVIRDMNPPKGEAYLRAARQRAALEDRSLEPFGSIWRHDAGSALADHVKPLALPPKVVQHLEDLGKDDDLAVATALEKAVNGTSLVLVFEIGKARLLFPGDAQWGTWTWLLEDPEWSDLLASTVFYKVGHHGSHNATVPAVVDGLKKPKLGMVSTREGTKDWDIPRAPLLAALRHKCPIVRSDEEDVDDPAGVTRETGYVDARVAL